MNLQCMNKCPIISNLIYLLKIKGRLVNSKYCNLQTLHKESKILLWVNLGKNQELVMLMFKMGENHQLISMVGVR